MEISLLNDLPSGSIDIAIDVGAALGSYSWVLSRKARRVFSFEPGLEHGAYLDGMIWGTNITLIKKAVGSSPGTARMFVPAADTNGLHSATLSANNPITASKSGLVREVSVITLDEFCRDTLGPHEQVDVLKVDVEGFELEVFHGASAMLAQHRPLIICEIEARHNRDYRKVFEFLQNLEYRTAAFIDGKYIYLTEFDIESLQKPSALEKRLSGNYDPSNNPYINNFVFQSDKSRVKVLS